MVAPASTQTLLPNAVIGVVVRIEDVADGLVGGLAQIVEHGAGAPRKIGVDHQHIVAKDHPAGVGDDLLVHLRIAEIDAGRDLVHQVGLAGGVAVEARQSEGERRQGRKGSAHEDKDITSAGQRLRKYGQRTQ